MGSFSSLMFPFMFSAPTAQAHTHRRNSFQILFRDGWQSYLTSSDMYEPIIKVLLPVGGKMVGSKLSTTAGFLAQRKLNVTLIFFSRSMVKKEKPFRHTHSPNHDGGINNHNNNMHISEI